MKDAIKSVFFQASKENFSALRTKTTLNLDKNYKALQRISSNREQIGSAYKKNNNIETIVEMFYSVLQMKGNFLLNSPLVFLSMNRTLFWLLSNK